MTLPEIVSLLPFIVLATTIVVVLLAIAFQRDHTLTLVLTLLGLIVTLITLPIVASNGAGQVTSLLRVDTFAIFFIALVVLTSFGVAILSYRYLELRIERREESYVLLLLATLGSSVVVAATHFASFFLGLEVLSVSLYALLAYARTRTSSLEAGIKYLILAAASAAFMLFGIALTYAEVGTLDFGQLASSMTQAVGQSPLLIAGLGLIIVGIGYKLAVVPFHLWTPDIYEGAPAPSVAFVATVSKAGMFALLLRLYIGLDVTPGTALFGIFLAIAIASMLVGNVLGMLQTNVKRVLAYSSIAHMGYVLIAFLAGSSLGVAAAAFYLVTYVAANLGAFGVITIVSDAGRDADSLDDYRGMFWRQPWLAGAFTIMLLSLAGIPLTGGFIGKLYLVVAGIGSALWIPAVILVISSVIGLFYYLRLTLPMYSRQKPEAGKTGLPVSVPAAGAWVLAVAVIVVIWLGVYPGPFLQAAQVAAGSLP